MRSSRPHAGRDHLGAVKSTPWPREVNGEEERNPRCSTLSTAEQELGILPVAHCENERGTYSSSKIGFNLSPVSVRSQALIQLLGQRHNGIELFRDDLICDYRRSVADLR